MTRRALLAAFAIVICLPLCGRAALIVDPPQPITRRVTVQAIQTSLDGGSSPATVLGNASQRATIEGKIDQIWAQAGIDVLILPTIVSYSNTFAYQGNGGTGTRSSNDLGSILNMAAAQGGILNSSSSVIDMFFVNVVPGFPPLDAGTAAGIANVGANGIAAYVGSNLLGFGGGTDAIASVLAHEIGHNLGLKHTADGTANVMSPNGTTDQLSAVQIAAVFQTTRRNDSVATIPTGGTGFPQPIATQLVGDYNGNGVVDAADYAVWRDTFGSTTNLVADGNGNHAIDSGDFTIWKNNFDEPAGAGGIAAGSIPEPPSLVLAVILTMLWLIHRRCSLRRS